MSHDLEVISYPIKEVNGIYLFRITIIDKNITLPNMKFIIFFICHTTAKYSHAVYQKSRIFHMILYICQ